MYDIRQFKPALYILLMMGFTGYALAAQAPGLWLLSVGGLVLNAWLVKSRRFRPMSRLLANAVTLVALLWVAAQIFELRNNYPILVIGQFLVLLQLVKLYEQRANRDFAQLLVLSLLLMVAASITTASLVFGILLIAYLFLSLYCCLLFHLKVETDEAKKAIALPEDQLNPNTIRQDQRFLSQSMRRLTGLVAAFSLVLAVVVFLFFPRGAGAGLFGQFQFRPGQTLTGFSDQVGFQQVARISQNEDIVAYLKVFKDEKPIQGDLLYLRGVTLDVYNGSDNSTGQKWQWSRSETDLNTQRMQLLENTAAQLAPAPSGPVYRQEFMLRPTGTRVIFALPGASQIVIDRRLELHYATKDGVIESLDPLIVPINYKVFSSNELNTIGAPPEDSMTPLRRLRRKFFRTQPAPLQSNIDPRIRDFALRSEVSGSDVQGPLGAQRTQLPERTPAPMDAEIASHIESYLQKNFAYTLDLTEARKLSDEDPMVSFLYDFKMGHCEYFAGAMALMCQSLGMDARVVVGFKCGADAYNNYTGVYIVKQSFAHAWVEVNTVDGWKTYDPTSGREVGANAGPKSLFQRMRGFFDFLEYTWANNVVAYDTESRESLIQNVEQKMTNTAIHSSQTFRDWANLADMLPSGLLSSIVTLFISLMVLALLIAVMWFFFERWKLRRRARRIGIEQLSTSDQLRLARQLGFYDDLMLLLERRQIARPQHLTPMEFSNSLCYLPIEAFDTIRRLTQIFYRIRFGQAELDSGQQRRLSRVIGEVESHLGPVPPTN